MATLDEITGAALERDALRLRSLVQDFLRETKNFETVTRPASSDPKSIACAASIVELLAMRRGQQAPAWTMSVPPAREPFYLLESAQTLTRLRKLCEDESPAPMRKRNFFAPPNFLEFA